MENPSPLISEYGVAKDDDRAVFPVINKTGEYLVLIPKDTFELVTTTESTIILRRISL